MQLYPGTIVDNKFRITAHIGGGGMGTAYSAEQLELGRNVALKVLVGAGPLELLGWFSNPAPKARSRLSSRP